MLATQHSKVVYHLDAMSSPPPPPICLFVRDMAAPTKPDHDHNHDNHDDHDDHDYQHNNNNTDNNNNTTITTRWSWKAKSSKIRSSNLRSMF